MQSISVLTENELSSLCLDVAFKIHKTLGPGLLESAYEQCLVYELRKLGLEVVSQHPIPLVYDGLRLEAGFRADILINGKLIVEIKSIEAVHELHAAQLLTYLRLTNCKLGLLINFNTVLLKDGIKRIINGTI